MKFYKVLLPDGTPCHGGRSWDKWGLPKPSRPGKWMHVDGKIIPCRNGLHLCRREDLIHWIGPTIFEAEIKGEIVAHDNKIVVADARLLRRLDTWNETTARLFAADCAKYAIRQAEKNGVEIDPRVKDTIKVVYRYAKGEATMKELVAARSAAYSAYSPCSAYWAARSAYLAARSAYLAAARPAYSAAYSAAHSAPYSAARKWQTKRLFEYLDGKRS